MKLESLQKILRTFVHPLQRRRLIIRIAYNEEDYEKQDNPKGEVGNGSNR